MNSVLKLSLTIAGLCWIASNAMAAILHVDCDGAGDRQAIQDAIDLAVEHDVVQVHGNCQLDGARVVIDKSHLTLRGDAFDNDGDGRMDEWQTVLQGNGEMNDLLTVP